jgi:predicted tellurium resistance membrane protein TerC
MPSCDEHIECLQEEIEDNRHFEDVGFAFISIGVAILSFSTIPAYVAGGILIVLGLSFVAIGGRDKGRAEAKLHELLKRLSESKKED